MSFSAAAADERVLEVAFSDDALSVSLRDGRIITVPLVWYPRLLTATPAQRTNWKVAGGGYGIHWPELDEDLSTEGLLRGARSPKAHAPNTSGKANLVLSDRDRHFASLIAQGLQNREIAALLGISEQAVSTHLRRMLRTLRLRDRHEIVEYLSPAKSAGRRFK